MRFRSVSTPTAKAWPGAAAFCAAVAIASSAHAASVVSDPVGDLRAPLEPSPRTDALDIVKASVHLATTRTETGPPLFGNFTLYGSMAGDIPADSQTDYIWVVNRNLGPGAETHLFADRDGDPGIVGDGYILARADHTLMFRDLSAVSELAARPIGRVDVEGPDIRITLPSDLLLQHAGGVTPSGFTAKDIQFAFLTGIEPVEESAALGAARRFFVADVAPDDGYLSVAGDRDPVVPGGVPEPAAWALMLAGFGLAGQALRRRGAQSGPGSLVHR